MKEIKHCQDIKEKNIKTFQTIANQIPQSLNISYKLMSYPHTQWMLGQWVSKLFRIASTPIESLKEEEKSLHCAAQMLLCLSPDVGISTNLSYNMDGRVFNPVSIKNTTSQWGVRDQRTPDITPDIKSKNRFIRFEITEASSVSCAASFGKIKQILGIPIIPLMTIYDFFIKRALDQYFYGLYWQSSFILAGTPSGITLSPEGAQHAWKSDIQIPNQICWEPFFCQELDWILTDALYRHFKDQNQEREGVLIRTVTKGVNQNLFLSYLRKQKRFKKDSSSILHAKNFPIKGAVDESLVESIDDKDILNLIRKDVLKGAYKWIDFSGYGDYQPQENLVNIFAMGALGSEAEKASNELLKKGIYANVIIVTSPDLLLGGFAHKNNYSYLTSHLELDEAVGILSVHDGESGILDNIGSILGKKHISLAVRKHSLCGRPEDVYKYHEIDSNHILEKSLSFFS